MSRPAAPPCPRPSWVTHAIQAPRIEHLELQERSLTRPGSRGGNLGTRAAEEGMRASRECPREHPVPFKEFSLKTENSVTSIYARRGPRTPLHFLQDEGDGRLTPPACRGLLSVPFTWKPQHRPGIGRAGAPRGTTAVTGKWGLPAPRKGCNYRVKQPGTAIR